MKTVHVAASRDYDVVIGRGAISGIGEHMRTGSGCVIVTDTNVAPLHLSAVHRVAENVGLRVHDFIFPAGEASKNVSVYLSLIERLAELRMARTDYVIALGGGVAGDLAGFAAATYMRGMGLIMLPTTLLACVDSSVGGKTAVDLPQGKNLLGAFYQPNLVVCDTALLETLPRDVFADGCAEVIKYGMIQSDELFSLLENTNIAQSLDDVIEMCVSIKRDIVQTDEFDNAGRRILNFGHTFGHAIEAESNYQMTHGKCVAIGMAMITRAAVRRGLCDASVAVRLFALLRKYGLPCDAPFDAVTIARRALADKKLCGDYITLIVPEKLGKCCLPNVPAAELADWAKDGGAP